MDDDLEFRGQLRDKGAYPVVAAAAVVLVAIIGIGLLPGNGGEAGGGVAVLPSPTPVPAPSSAPSPAAARVRVPEAVGSAIEPGSYAMQWGHMWIHLAVPAGWSSTDSGTTVYKEDGHPGRYNAPTLSVHAVTRVVRDVCAQWPRLVYVGPTVEDLTTALANQVGIDRLGPTDVVLGGYPTRKFVLTIPGSCAGSEGHWIWGTLGKTTFGVFEDGIGTIYIVDVNGDRLVITTHYRGASAQNIAEIEAIIASLDIELSPPLAPAGVVPQGDPGPAGGRVMGSMVGLPGQGSLEQNGTACRSR